ncbi:MAG TPA: DNA primase [Sphingomonas sp.]|nr:DNA primase [Sphingomonas sp.]
MTTGGYQVPGHGSGDDGYDEDGYDESQRAEILEVTQSGPSDGTIQTDLDPDIEDEDALEDLEMTDDELGEEDDNRRESDEDMDEDTVQDEFDDDSFADDDLDDEDDDALNP